MNNQATASKQHSWGQNAAAAARVSLPVGAITGAVAGVVVGASGTALIPNAFVPIFLAIAVAAIVATAFGTAFALAYASTCHEAPSPPRKQLQQQQPLQRMSLDACLSAQQELLQRAQSAATAAAAAVGLMAPVTPATSSELPNPALTAVLLTRQEGQEATTPQAAVAAWAADGAASGLPVQLQAALSRLSNSRGDASQHVSAESVRQITPGDDAAGEGDVNEAKVAEEVTEQNDSDVGSEAPRAALRRTVSSRSPRKNPKALARLAPPATLVHAAELLMRLPPGALQPQEAPPLPQPSANALLIETDSSSLLLGKTACRELQAAFPPPPLPLQRQTPRLSEAQFDYFTEAPAYHTPLRLSWPSQHQREGQTPSTAEDSGDAEESRKSSATDPAYRRGSSLANSLAAHVAASLLHTRPATDDNSEAGWASRESSMDGRYSSSTYSDSRRCMGHPLLAGRQRGGTARASIDVVPLLMRPVAEQRRSLPLDVRQRLRQLMVVNDSGPPTPAMVPPRPPYLHSDSGTSYQSSVRSCVSSCELRRVSGLPDDFSPWQLKREDVVICLQPNGQEVSLGSGGFGEVVLAMLKGAIPVAVKRLLGDSEGLRQDQFLREVALLKALVNTNIVQFQGACLGKGELLLVTEFMEGGDLCKALARRTVTWDRRGASIALDVARGLHFLHSNGVVHMDLKTPNILLTRHGIAKLADVGVARIKNSAIITTAIEGEAAEGTFEWTAPEVLLEQDCTDKADIFSFGVVLWELVTGEQPTRGRMREVRVPDECPQAVADLIDGCMSEDPHERPSALDVCSTLRRIARAQLAMRANDRRLAAQHSRRVALEQLVRAEFAGGPPPAPAGGIAGRSSYEADPSRLSFTGSGIASGSSYEMDSSRASMESIRGHETATAAILASNLARLEVVQEEAARRASPHKQGSSPMVRRSVPLGTSAGVKSSRSLSAPEAVFREVPIFIAERCKAELYSPPDRFTGFGGIKTSAVP